MIQLSMNQLSKANCTTVVVFFFQLVRVWFILNRTQIILAMYIVVNVA